MLRCESLRLKQGSRTLLQTLDWQVNAGECWWIAGRNGCGKSTLLATLAGLQRQDEGRITLNGKAANTLGARQQAQTLSLLPQHLHDAFDYSVSDAISSARFAWPNDGSTPSRLQQALACFDLLHLAQRPLQALSGGERQRVALAGVMMQDTPLILLDEPSSALDLAHQAALQQQITHWREAGKAILLVSHDLQLAPSCASHALLLDDKGTSQQMPIAALEAACLAAVLGHPLSKITHAGHPCFLPGHTS